MTLKDKACVLHGWHGKYLMGSLMVVTASFSLTACTSKEITKLRETVKVQGERLQRLEDIQAIERLQRAYGYYVDKNLWDQVVDLFADKSSVELDQRGIFLNKEGVRRMFLENRGRSAILRSQISLDRST